MRGLARRWRRLLEHGLGQLFAVGASLFALVMYWYHPLPLERLDVQSRDVVFALREPPRAVSDVAVVAVDEKAIKTYGRWPWPRELQARLLNALKQTAAGTIAIDVIYLRPEAPAADAALAAALAAPGPPVVGGYFFRSERTVDVNMAAMERLRDNRVRLIQRTPGARTDTLFRFPYVEKNQAFLAQHMARVGFFNYIPDPDGLLRSTPLLLRHDADIYPALSVAALAEYLRADVAVRFDAAGVGSIRVGSHEIPTDIRGRFALNFYAEDSIPVVSAADVLDGRAGPALSGKLVFVGVTETGIADVRPTPVHPSFPGVLAHATVASNVLQQFYLFRDTRTVVVDVVLMALLPYLLVSVLSRTRRQSIIVLGFFGTLVLFWWGYYFFVTRTGLLVSLAYPMMAVLVTFVLFQAYTVLVVQRQSRFLKKAFASYVSPALVNRVIERPGDLSLAGERREITILFSDIRSFTSISEHLDPETLVSLLNRYLGPMTDIIMEEEGTLDKYVGDAIMAIFNAPLPLPAHPRRAARAALRMRAKLADLNEVFVEEYGVELNTGIGLHTGEAVVGNMGSEKRFDYTAVGDTVNLASRVEGLTKAYQVPIVVTESVESQLRSYYLFRRLDRIQVKGKREAVTVFELLGDLDTSSVKAALARRFNAALESYFNRDFQIAAERFDAILSDFPNDGPSRVFRQRCRRYIEVPPPSPWDGVHVATHK